MKRTGALCPDGLYLTQQQLQLVDGPAEPKRDRLCGVAIGLRVLEGALGVKPGEHRHGLSQTRDRERGRKRAAELINTRFQALKARAELILERVRGHLFAP